MESSPCLIPVTTGLSGGADALLRCNGTGRLGLWSLGVCALTHEEEVSSEDVVMTKEPISSGLVRPPHRPGSVRTEAAAMRALCGGQK